MYRIGKMVKIKYPITVPWSMVCGSHLPVGMTMGISGEKAKNKQTE
jgi:hypothetical protein